MRSQIVTSKKKTKLKDAIFVLKKQNAMEIEVIQNKIFEIRGCKVMLDFDLALIYGIENRILKQTVKRNFKRFPEDFMFPLSES